MKSDQLDQGNAQNLHIPDTARSRARSIEGKPKKPSRPLSTDPKAVRKREKRARETAEEAEARRAKARSDQQKRRRINSADEGSTMRVYKPRNRDGQTSIGASDSSTAGNQPSKSKMLEDNDK
ncbi:hypothetical protein WR25_15431 [Diploscapter pachys]|uniref:Uncharacterized protein n=1 Tax=Diploscapter pachys TaxID=2018661 RepID=A0A2A2JFD9_9BILA|nr:hypothetical protein WR25_15431 [Diploscapter pachys]